jgi:hypothetical protein
VTPDQFPFRDLTTPAGIAVAAILIRQVIEMAKHSFLPWLDRGNERKGAFIVSAVLYLLWLVFYGTDLSTDGPLAFAAFWAAATATIGANETVDAAKGVVARNVAGAAADTAATADAADPTAGTAIGTATIDDSMDRSAPMETGPAFDLLVDAGEAVAEFEDAPQDPALSPAG